MPRLARPHRGKRQQLTHESLADDLAKSGQSAAENGNSRNMHGFGFDWSAFQAPGTHAAASTTNNDGQQRSICPAFATISLPSFNPLEHSRSTAPLPREPPPSASSTPPSAMQPQPQPASLLAHISRFPPFAKLAGFGRPTAATDSIPPTSTTPAPPDPSSSSGTSKAPPSKTTPPAPAPATPAPATDPEAEAQKSGGGGGGGSWFGLPGRPALSLDLRPPQLPANLQAALDHLWVQLAPPGHPNKKRLMTVQEFFSYTELEGRKFFRELDRDGDEKVSLDDVRAALRRRKLPEAYAKEFISAARGSRWWSNTIGWDDFKSLVDEREAKMLRAFTAMEVNSAGQLQLGEIKNTLTKLGLSATDENARAMIKAIGEEKEDGLVSYGKFRNFLILLPETKLGPQADPSLVWFESATMVPFGPPPESNNTGKLLLRAALAGGIASGGSTLLMHPIDTIKTRVQSAAGASFKEVIRSVPQIGVRGLYRGIVPAASGSFVSHGLRTFSYEACFQILRAVSGGAMELQAQGLASGMGTFLGTCVRIPCEVLKQRLQVGRHANVAEAVAAATAVEGPAGLFRGTAATLSREVPFYVFGMVGYEQLKKLANGQAFGRKRELAPWETIAVGACAGALAALLTTPADVMKTRIMTAAADQAINSRQILLTILANEGVGALFKGALPRMVWIAPLGAMNFAGYELAKKALSEGDRRRQLQQQQEAEEGRALKAEPAL